jgi:hypothetical protein
VWSPTYYNRALISVEDWEKSNREDYTLLIVIHTLCTLDWASPLINLFRRGPGRTTMIPPRKDSHLDYMTDKRACLVRPVAFNRGKFGCSPNTGFGTVRNGTYYSQHLECPHICN